MEIALDWISGISWTAVYVVAICCGINKKTYCIPFVCICLNFSWEISAVITRVLEKSYLDSGFISQLMWFVFDVGIVYTWFYYDKSKSLKRKILILILCVILMNSFLVTFDLWKETAFVINLLMSLAFLFRIDGSVVPQCLSIAVMKCLGTISATILHAFYYSDFFVLTVGGLCLLADMYYIFEINRFKRQ